MVNPAFKASQPQILADDDTDTTTRVMGLRSPHFPPSLLPQSIMDKVRNQISDLAPEWKVWRRKISWGVSRTSPASWS